MRTVKSIIEDLGGATKVADLHSTAIPVKTIYDWVQKNFVPEWRRTELKVIAVRQGVDLKDEDFPEKDQKPKRAA